MQRRILAGFMGVVGAMWAQSAGTSAAAGTACGNLAALTIPDVTVNAATLMPAGPFTPGGSLTMTLPAFCRVEATARPTSDSEIKFEVWIPPAEAWNGKFQGVGNGGYQGSISYGAIATKDGLIEDPRKCAFDPATLVCKAGADTQRA